MTAPIALIAACEKSRRLKEPIYPLSLINCLAVNAETIQSNETLTIFPKKKLTNDKIPFFTPLEWDTT